MDQKTKEELIKLALGKTKDIKDYKSALGFDDVQKFKDAYGLEFVKDGKSIPCAIVYYFYYQWVKSTSWHKPVKYGKFFYLTGINNIKSIIYRNGYLKTTTRVYRIKNFPQYTIEDEVSARKLIRGQKRKAKNKKRKKEKTRSNKEILQSEN